MADPSHELPIRPANLDHLRLTWVLPPLSRGSGGLDNIARAIDGLRQRGHDQHVHVLNPSGRLASDIQSEATRWFPQLGDVCVAPEPLPEADILLATSWPTSYVVRATGIARHRVYWVQDHEVLFHPAGTERTLADATYDMGLYGIFLGPWLADELSTLHGMDGSHYEFGVDLEKYRPRPREGSLPPAVAFYARPTTPRRGFELGIAALSMLHSARPDVVFHLFGERLGRVRLPFPAVRHDVIGHAALAQLYQSCSVGLVLSFTNLSLIPLEMLAAGLPVVVNSGPYNERNLQNPWVTYPMPTPQALAASLAQVIDSTRDPLNISQSVQQFAWEGAIDRIEGILKELALTPPTQVV